MCVGASTSKNFDFRKYIESPEATRLPVASSLEKRYQDQPPVSPKINSTHISDAFLHILRGGHEKTTPLARGRFCRSAMRLAPDANATVARRGASVVHRVAQASLGDKRFQAGSVLFIAANDCRFSSSDSRSGASGRE